MEMIYSSVLDNKNKLNSDYSDCSDFLLRECVVAGSRAIVCVLDGMIDSLQLSQLIMSPILNYNGKGKKNRELFDEIKLSVINSLEMSEIKSFDDIYYFLSSGFAVLMIDGVAGALALGIQGFEKRSVSEPSNEANIKGAKECFTETLNDNKAMLHRRIKTPNLKLKQLKIGGEAKTSVVLAYIKGVADVRLVADVEARIVTAPIENLQDYGMLVPYLDSSVKSFFSAVGNTERAEAVLKAA